MAETWYPVSSGLATVEHLSERITREDLGKASVCVEGGRDHGRGVERGCQARVCPHRGGQSEPRTSETETT